MSEATLTEIWRTREEWSRESRAHKKRQQYARLAALSCGALGALLGTYASILSTAKPIFGVLSGILIVLSGYLGKELLKPEADTYWSRARMLAEGLKRECWLYVMRVPPFDQDDTRAGELAERAQNLSNNLRLSDTVAPNQTKVDLPIANSIEDYIADRAYEQANWYGKRAFELRQSAAAYTRVTLALGAFSAIMPIVGARYSDLLYAIPLLTTVTAAVIAWTQSNRASSLASLYGKTQTQLRFHIAEWIDASQARSTMPSDQQLTKQQAFVQRCEDIMARENGSWRAEWLSEEKVKKSEAEIQAFLKAAEKASTLKARGKGGS